VSTNLAHVWRFGWGGDLSNDSVEFLYGFEEFSGLFG